MTRREIINKILDYKESAIISTLTDLQIPQYSIHTIGLHNFLETLFEDGNTDLGLTLLRKLETLSDTTKLGGYNL